MVHSPRSTVGYCAFRASVRVVGVLRGVGPAVSRWLMLGVAGLGLAACLLHDPSDEAKPNDPRAQSVTDLVRAIDLSPRQPLPVQDSGLSGVQPTRDAIYLGDTTAPIKASPTAGSEATS